MKCFCTGGNVSRLIVPLVCLTLSLKAPAQPPPVSMPLESLDLTKMSAGWGRPLVAQSIEGKPMTLGGVVYTHGVGTHAPSEMLIDLKGAVDRFEAVVGLDDERKGQGSIAFEVWADDKRIAETGPMHGGDAPKTLSLTLTGRKRLLLIVTDAGDGNANDHADWADARLILSPNAKVSPEATAVASGPPPVLHFGNSPVPAIHGPRLVGTTPGRPFLYLIPVTGQAPLTFAAKGLPAGVSLDPRKGILSGSVRKPGTYPVSLTVRGPRGVGSRTLKIVTGNNKLALTPPMGWNSWYAFYDGVGQKQMQGAADALIRSGLAAHGYRYVNIDDGWSGKRTESGEIEPNAKFPDMKALADYIHAQGLLFGTYTSPGPKTCAGYEGSFGHEAQDAATYASWGVDFVKHDWCSYGEKAKDGSLTEFQKPYIAMRRAMDATGRDMVYNLCQYGMGEVWKWGARIGANSWRTTGDSGDSWGTVSSIGFGQAGLERYAGPGHWNDPDYLQVGMLGSGGNLHPTHLAPNEAITQVTLWSLMAAPLFLSCDLTHLDRFTLSLLTNDEVIDVDQDPLGRAAGRKAKNEMTEVWARPLSDGTTAVGLFNRGVFHAKVTARWAEIGVQGSRQVRDLWRQKSLGAFRDAFTADVPAHGALFLKIGTPKANAGR